MMKHRLLSFILFPLLFGFFHLSTAHGEGPGISIEPGGPYLFNIENAKPGDWVERSLTVRNNGDEDITYTLAVVNLSETDVLYNELDLTMLRGKTTLFDGKLKDASSFKARELAQGSADELIFIVKMPYELGNEFQGTAARFEIQVQASSFLSPDTGLKDVEGTNGGTAVSTEGGPSPTGFLPNTGTDLYRWLLIGGLLMATGIIILACNVLMKRKSESTG
ncbi:LPXTG cell wall anchor domain-containing protein [Rossellomorea marisflavi]|uniref:LPXTG cell wall anchor domain-containing protein n=1 Tax=Rossellomorea marisflavi TaxID=189381 RepID=UPI00345C9EC1